MKFLSKYMKKSHIQAYEVIFWFIFIGIALGGFALIMVAVGFIINSIYI
jgi:ABC-type lipoprotein release transport system permease subunit